MNIFALLLTRCSRIVISSLNDRNIARYIVFQGYNKTMIPTPSPSNISSYFFSQYDQDLFLDQYVFKGRLKVSPTLKSHWTIEGSLRQCRNYIVPPIHFVSHGNLGEFLRRDRKSIVPSIIYFPKIQDGFFVEAGSTDSVTHSNSLVRKKNKSTVCEFWIFSF